MRVSNVPVTRKRRKKWITLAKGYWGHKSIGYKTAKQAVVKSWTYAFRDRKQVKRDYRGLWILRINAACRAEGITYSRFIEGLRKANIVLNRKMLAELTLRDEKIFSQLVSEARKNLSF